MRRSGYVCTDGIHIIWEIAKMKPVGIIANPASGKDIRRLIASGTVVTNQEKINIVVRMLKGMDALGVKQIYIMPDPSHIGQRAIEEVADELEITVAAILDMSYILGTYKDTLRASEQMRQQDFAAIIVMGGDGTCRVVSKACGDIPMVPVSTGTNNVFPQMVEGTLAGLAAGAIATGKVGLDKGCYRAPVLELRNAAGEVIDTALVDLAVVDARDIGSRAVWDPTSIRELFLTRAHPSEIGLSSIGGWLHPLETIGEAALHVVLDPAGKTRVTAPIAPGLVSTVNVLEYQTFDQTSSLPIKKTPSTIALDGEREVVLPAGEKMSVRFNPQGPLVVDLARTLEEAAKAGLMSSKEPLQSVAQILETKG
jgi:predicted polyphosphate/ATP-dependent NAD kinase